MTNVLGGGDGNDKLSGGGGNDLVVGGIGDDTVGGEDGLDALSGEGGAEIRCSPAAMVTTAWMAVKVPDRISTENGNDRAAGGAGDDTLLGQGGDDILSGDEGFDTADGADGTDMCRAAEKTSKCEDTTLDPTAALRASVTVPPAPPDTFTVDGAFQDVSLTLETNGGINPWDVSFGIARDYMHGITDILAGPAYDITVPKGAPAISGGRLTLPYGEALLGGFPEANLRIYTYDTDAQLWVPLAEPQTVDTAANTVTANISHLSVYAVLKGRTPAEWRQVFGETPIRCVGGVGGGFGIDASFLVDTSGSMASNDPSGLRVDGAEAVRGADAPRRSRVGGRLRLLRDPRDRADDAQQPGERQRSHATTTPDTAATWAASSSSVPPN